MIYRAQSLSMAELATIYSDGKSPHYEYKLHCAGEVREEVSKVGNTYMVLEGPLETEYEGFPTIRFKRLIFSGLYMRDIIAKGGSHKGLITIRGYSEDRSIRLYGLGDE